MIGVKIKWIRSEEKKSREGERERVIIIKQKESQCSNEFLGSLSSSLRLATRHRNLAAAAAAGGAGCWCWCCFRCYSFTLNISYTYIYAAVVVVVVVVVALSLDPLAANLPIDFSFAISMRELVLAWLVGWLILNT